MLYGLFVIFKLNFRLNYNFKYNSFTKELHLIKMDMRTDAQKDQRANAGFAAHPRVVQQKPKYKDPYGGGVQE